MSQWIVDENGLVLTVEQVMEEVRENIRNCGKAFNTNSNDDYANNGDYLFRDFGKFGSTCLYDDFDN